MSWLERLANVVRTGKVERQIRRELEFHAAERADELRASGLSSEEAARRARVQLGNPLLQAERTRDVDLALWADGILRNLRHAVRSLLRAPGFTLTVIATLALGIGANTAVFSALDAVLLRPLPFPHADRLVRLVQTQEASSESGIAPVRLEEWNRLNSSLSAISGYFIEDVSETSGDLPEKVRRAIVTPRMLDVWGVSPRAGARLQRRGVPVWRAARGADQRPLLAQSAGLEPRRAAPQRAHRNRFRGDRGRDARLLPVSRPGGGPLVPVAGGRAVRPVASEHVVQGNWPLARGRDPRPGRADLAAVQARLAEQFPDPIGRLSVQLSR